MTLDLPGRSEIISDLKAFNLTPPAVRGAMREGMLTGSGDEGLHFTGRLSSFCQGVSYSCGGGYWGRGDILYLMIIYC